MKKIIILAIALFIYGMTINAQSFKIIVNNANPVSSVSKADASAFFLKKKAKWANNAVVIPVDLSSKSSVRADFSEVIHKKSVSQVRAFWQQSVFAGKETPPQEMKDDNAVIDFVKANEGAIGYVSSSTATSGVKVLTLN
ncbi:MAG: hypothetical protein P1P88_08695 [Bacteroidales bacterium]|nr:hypothetical protein [Bacteroidales bacterium]